MTGMIKSVTMESAKLENEVKELTERVGVRCTLYRRWTT